MFGSMGNSSEPDLVESPLAQPELLALDPQPVFDAETEQRVDSNLHRMFRRDFLFVLGGVLPLAISALILPVLARVMGRTQFGIVSFAIAIAAVQMVVISLGLQTGVQREYPKIDGPERTRVLIAMAVVVMTLISAAFAVSAQFWSSPIGASGFPWAMALISWYSGGSALTLICLGFLRSADRVAGFLVVVFTQSIGAQAIGLTLVLLHHSDARNYLTGLLVGQTAATAIALVLVRPRFRGMLRLGFVSGVLAFSIPLIPQQLASFILWSGDRVVVERDLGSGAQARYAVAYAVGAITVNVVNQLNQAWLPRVFTIDNVSERRKLLQQAQKRLFRLLAFAVFGLSLAVPFLLIAASPKSYDPRQLTFVALLIVPTSVPLSIALSNARSILARGHSGRLAATTMTCAVFNVVLNVFLVPSYGIAGSAFATLISYGLLAWLSTLWVLLDEGRISGRLTAEFKQWLLVGCCLLTGLIPWSLAGVASRLAALTGLVVVAVLVFGVFGRAGRRRLAYSQTGVA